MDSNLDLPKKFFPGPYFVEKIRATRKTTNTDAISITGGIITTSGKKFSGH